MIDFIIALYLVPYVICALAAAVGMLSEPRIVTHADLKISAAITVTPIANLLVALMVLGATADSIISRAFDAPVLGRLLRRAGTYLSADQRLLFKK